MTQPDVPKRALYEDEHASEEDETLHLDQASLVDTLHQWKTIGSLTTLRTHLSDFKHTLGNPQHPLRVRRTESDYVEFRRTYLFGELDQIASSLTLERAIYYVERLIKSVTEVRTGSVNDINLNRWKEYEDIYTDSLWLVDRRDGSGSHTAGYWGNFIPQIPHQMIRRYTKQGDWVLDTFAGSGTTLIEGQRLGRNTIGIELQDRMVQHAKQLVAAEPNTHSVTIDVVHGDSSDMDYTSLLNAYGKKSVQLVIMHPPYFDIIKFSEDPRDLSNAASVDTFLAMIGKIVDNAAQILDKGRYLVVVIGDKYVKGDLIPLGFQTMNAVIQRGFSLKSIIVKNFEDTSGKRHQKDLWRYRALVGGFYIFKHEYIFLFKKN
jgi:hypothetical protein